METSTQVGYKFYDQSKNLEFSENIEIREGQLRPYVESADSFLKRGLYMLQSLDARLCSVDKCKEWTRVSYCHQKSYQEDPDTMRKISSSERKRESSLAHKLVAEKIADLRANYKEYYGSFHSLLTLFGNDLSDLLLRFSTEDDTTEEELLPSEKAKRRDCIIQ